MELGNSQVSFKTRGAWVTCKPERSVTEVGLDVGIAMVCSIGTDVVFTILQALCMAPTKIAWFVIKGMHAFSG
jgi:hypothetical protein